MPESPWPAIERRFGLQFRDPRLLEQAFTTRTYAHDIDRDAPHNDDLIFIGEAVFTLAVKEYLCDQAHDSGKTPGRMFGALMPSSPLEALAQEHGLLAYAQYGPGEDVSSDKTRAALSAKLLRALIGAVYRDQGMEAASSFVRDLIGPIVSRLDVGREESNPRGKFNDLVFARTGNFPQYRTVSRQGPDHALQYRVEVLVGDVVQAAAWGPSVRAASNKAAAIALEQADASELAPVIS